MLIPAAGSGRRMQAGQNKVLLPIHGTPLISWTLRPFLEEKTRSGPIVLIISEADRQSFSQLPEVVSGQVQLVRGGAERKDSVYAGLRYLEEQGWSDDALVLIHDAARCMISRELLGRVLDVSRGEAALTTAVPIVDTLLRVDEGGDQTVSRDGMYAIQTPQMFQCSLLKQAHLAWEGDATDDASMVRPLHKVAIVPGCRQNIKVTRPEDLAFAERFLT